MKLILLAVLMSLFLIPVNTGVAAYSSFSIQSDEVILSEMQYHCTLNLFGPLDEGDVVLVSLIASEDTLRFTEEYPAEKTMLLTFDAAELTDNVQIIWMDSNREEKTHSVISFDTLYAFTWTDLATALHAVNAAYANSVEKSDEMVNFNSGRIIVKCVSSLPDISEYHPIVTVIDEDGHFFIQFSSAVGASSCAEYLSQQPEILYAEPDGEVSSD